MPRTSNDIFFAAKLPYAKKECIQFRNRMHLKSVKNQNDVVLLRLERGLKVPKTLVLTITPQDNPATHQGACLSWKRRCKSTAFSRMSQTYPLIFFLEVAWRQQEYAPFCPRIQLWHVTKGAGSTKKAYARTCVRLFYCIFARSKATKQT